jgi:uncharacterized protein
MPDIPVVTNNTVASRFEAATNAGLARLDYVVSGNTIELVHTYVPEGATTHGVGSALARYALEHARANGLKVVPTCPFVRAFLERHPEYQDLRASA